jgi:hypothetical protein
MYDEMPLGFSQYATDGTRKVLKLKKTLYGPKSMSTSEVYYQKA